MSKVNKIVNRYEVNDLVVIIDELLELMEKVMPEDEFKNREQDASLLRKKLSSIKEGVNGPLNIFLEETLMETVESIKSRLKQRQTGNEVLDIINGVEIESLNSIIPSKYIIPNNKLANNLTKGIVGEYESIDVVVSGNRRKEITTKVSLNYDDTNIKIYDKNKRFTPYDRSVHNAICSLYEAGNINFTPEQIYRCMNGLNDSQYVSPQAIGSITRSLDKSRRILTTIDYTDEAKAYGKSLKGCIIEDYILSAKKIMLEAGGHKVVGYKLNSKPILYEYAQVTGQVLTVPSKILNTKDVLNSTKDVIIIREYLIRRVEVMKSSDKQSNNVLLERIYEELGLINPSKKKALNIRQSIDSILEYWKDEKYIKNFKFYKEGRAFKGISIFF